MMTSIIGIRPFCRQVGAHPIIVSILLLFIPEQVEEHTLQPVGIVASADFVDGQGGPVYLASGLLGLDDYIVSGRNNRPAQQCGCVIHCNLL